MRNSEETWEDGAFSAYASGHPDYGWAVYNSVTHNLIGDSLFVIKLIDGSLKKMWIISKQSALSKYTFRFANIDGTNDTTVVLDCNPYSTKNYVYYSLSSRQLLDREPAKDSWDLLFTKYIAAQPSGGFYTVTGVLSNNGVEVAKASQIDTTIVNWADFSMSDFRSVIGWDWKAFSMTTFSYQVADSLVYFIKNIDGEIYKLRFTGFAGSSTGKVYLTKNMLSATTINAAEKNYSFKIFPNPANENISIQPNADFGNNSAITIFDVNGKIVFYKSNILQNENINVSEFSKGL